MGTFIAVVTKYLFILLMLFYTWESFSALRHKRAEDKSGIFQRQNAIIFITYILGIVTVFLNQQDTSEVSVIVLGGMGIRHLSMSPKLISSTKELLSRFNIQELQAISDRHLNKFWDEGITR